MSTIACVGFSCLDILIRGVEVTDRNAALSFNTLDSYHAPVELYHGGDAMNEAMCAAKLGSSVKLITGIGNDETGRYLMGFARREGIDVTDVVVGDGDKTGISVCFIQKSNGERYFIRPLEPFMDFSFDLAALNGMKIVSIGSLFIPPFNKPDLVSDILRYAGEKGIITCVDTKKPSESPENTDTFIRLFPYIDYFFPNEEEGSLLSGETDHRLIVRKLLEYGVKNVVLKIGDKGCLLGNRDGIRHVPSIPGKMVDSTGAGDSFMGAFMTGLADDMKPLDCARLACVVASQTIRVTGASTGVPTKEKALEIMKEYYR